MYSRNSQTFRDDFDDISEEEYELYKYNLPPKYDGSRFRTRRNHQRKRSNTADADMTEDIQELPSDEYVEETFDEISEIEEEDFQESSQVSSTVKEEESVKREHGLFDNLLGHIGDKFGSEEILIISLILILSGENGLEDSGDIILLLALLLIAG